MAFVKADRVQEISRTNGTGDLYLYGSYNVSYRTFASQMANGDTCQILVINDTTPSEWEVSEASYSASENKLIRNVVLSSSNGNALVNFSSGVKRVAMTPPSSAMVVEDNAGNAAVANGLTVGGALTYGGVTASAAVTGTGPLVLGNSPTLTAPNLGTPASLNLANATNLPIPSGVTGTLSVAKGGTNATTTDAASASLSTAYVVSNLTALKALTTRPPVVFMNGYATDNDGGEGFWEWVVGSSATANDGTVVQCTSGAAGRYFRVVGDTIRPEWFGAKGDYVTDDSTAFTNAAAACAGHALLLNPAKTGYRFGITIPSTSGCSGVISIGGKAKVSTPTGVNSNVIYCQRSDFVVDNLYFDLLISTNPLVAPAVNTAIRNYSGDSATRWRITNNRIVGGYHSIVIYNCTDVQISNNICSGFWGESIAVDLVSDLNILDNIVEDGGYSATASSGTIRTSAPDTVTGQNMIISRNIVRNTFANGGNALDCFTPGGAKNFVISDNILDRNGDGIELKTYTVVPPENVYRHILVANNVIRLLDTGVTQAGIALNIGGGGPIPDGKAANIFITGNYIYCDTALTSAANVYGVSASCYDNLTVSGNRFSNLGRGVAFAPSYTVSSIMNNTVIENNVMEVGEAIRCSAAGTVNNLRVRNNDMVGDYPMYLRTATYNNPVIENNRVTSTSSNAFQFENFVNGVIRNNSITMSAANYAMYCVGTGTTGTLITSNMLETDATVGLDALRVESGNAVVVLNNHFSVPSTKRGIVIIAGATVTAANNVRGTATAAPASAAAIGDTWLNSAPASGAALSWVCVTAGNAGAAVFGTTGLGPALTGTTLGLTGDSTIQNATAIPAGGTAGAGYKFSSTSNFGVFFGSGAPTLSAAKGSLYLRSDGSTTNDRAYINTNGTTTWTALTTVA